LGTGDAGAFLSGGSFFYDDARNIFYNPSYVNDFKNWGIIEKSNAPGNTAEGGFVTSLGAFNLGLYFNRLSGINNMVGNPGTFNNMRPIEAFFGGDAGNLKWGLGLDYAAASTTTAGTSNSNTEMKIRAGVQVADFEPFGWATLIGADKIATGGGDGNKYKTYGFGLRYKMGEWIPYAGWRMDKRTAAATTADTKATTWLVGLGRTTKIGEGARMNYAVAFARNNNGASNPTGRSVIPVNVSVEADANSWLTARAGLSHNLYDQTNAGTSDENTTGRIGLGIHIGKADLDFAVGKSTLTEQTASTGETAGGIDSQTFDIGSGFFSQASVAYHW